jgi:predicted ATPase/DNA-binding SARP family transcriptional activator
VQVHALRKRIGQERVVTEGPGYRFCVEPDELDAARFEQLVARGRCERAEGAADAAVATLRQALALWRGPALSDVAYETFAQAEIVRLEELRVVAVEERIEAELALAHHADLVPELEALVADQPSRERLHGQLMLALYRCGRQTDGLAGFRRARRVLRDELGLEPGPELRELQQAILRHDAALRIESRELRARRHLPAPPTALIGRRREVDEVSGLLRSTTRLVTLTGPGGTGKTRLAVQIAHDLADAFADGVYFVDLANLRDPSLIASTITHALAVEEQRDTPVLQTLQAHLRERRLLLLLDNFEVVEDAAPLLGDLLNAAPELSLLVTSRTPLRLSGEHEIRVPPLPLSAAVQLFATPARAVAPGFRRPSEEADEVAEICRRLDCLPLAIELAAARTREYAPAEMLDVLPRALDLASEGARDLPARQRTLRDTIGWSHELLAPDEQALFARLAVFAGGCTVEAVQDVCGAGRGALASLVAKNLLYERLGRNGTLRFFMLETVHEYAVESLEASGDATRLRRRHAQHFAAFAEASEMDRHAPETWFGLLDEEHDNLRAAITWSSKASAVELQLRIVGALPRFWIIRGHLWEARSRLDTALERGKDGPAALRAKVLWGAARIAQCLGDYRTMHAFAERSLAVYRSVDDRRGTAWALDRLATATTNLGDVQRGISLYGESAEIFRALGDELGLAITLNNLSCLFLLQGEPEDAAALAAESLALCEKLGRRYGMVPPLGNLGLAAFMQDQYEEAAALFRQGIELAHELEYSEALVCCLVGLAADLAATDDAEQAATLLGAADAEARRIGLAIEPLERGVRERTVDAVKATLGRERFDDLYAAGRELDADETVVFAVAQTEPRVTGPTA